MISFRLSTAFFVSALAIALWLVLGQVEAAAIGERSSVSLYMTAAFAMSALALMVYPMISRSASRPLLALAIILAAVSVPLGLTFLKEDRVSQVLAVLALAGIPAVVQILHARAMRQNSYAELFRKVKYNGIKVSRFWADMLIRSQHEPYWTINGQNHPRIRYGDEDGMAGNSGPCRHCAAAPGQYHALSCEAEHCPACNAQRFCCDCDCKDCTIQFDVRADAIT